jgi:hypothetical protein
MEWDEAESVAIAISDGFILPIVMLDDGGALVRSSLTLEN